MKKFEFFCTAINKFLQTRGNLLPLCLFITCTKQHHCNIRHPSLPPGDSPHPPSLRAPSLKQPAQVVLICRNDGTNSAPLKAQACFSRILLLLSVSWLFQPSLRCCHKVRFRAVSHNSVRCLKILLKFFVNVYRCDPLARFPGNLPLSARFSIFSLRITCPKNSSCLFSMHRSKFRF